MIFFVQREEMRYLRVQYLGDPSGSRGTPSPRWEVCVSEGGRVWGELETGTSTRMLPSDFRIPDHRPFFEIPQEVQHEDLIRQLKPNYDGIIVSLVAPGGHRERSFLMTQVPEHSSLRVAIQGLQDQIGQLTRQ